jgi:MOSC domain-containing protein YiiM
MELPAKDRHVISPGLVMETPRVEAIYIAAEAGAKMQRVAEIEAVAGQGLAGDRYLRGEGHYSPTDTCELTLIEAEALERMEAKFGVRVSHGEHRRNLVTRGVRHVELRGKRFAIGAVVVEYDRGRPPCGYLQRITEPGMTKAMGEGAGICVRVLEGGMIREGDGIEILPGESSRRLRRLP